MHHTDTSNAANQGKKRRANTWPRYQGARKRRSLSMETVANRAFTSRKTGRRVEEGDHSVSIGIYASVLNTLGLLVGLAIISGLT